MSFDNQKMRKDIMAPSWIYSLKKVIKTEIKVENFILHFFIAIFSKRASWQGLFYKNKAASIEAEKGTSPLFTCIVITEAPPWLGLRGRKFWFYIGLERWKMHLPG